MSTRGLVFCLAICIVVFQVKSSNTKDYFKFNSNSSKSIALAEFQERLKFYKSLISKWGIGKQVELIFDQDILDITLKVKGEISDNKGLPVNWKYFLSTCDFTPFKEKVGEPIMMFIQQNPNLKNDLFINIIILTYQVLYYRMPEKNRIAHYYEKYFFKSAKYNTKVYQLTKKNNVKKYFSIIIPSHSNLKLHSIFFNEKELELAKKLGLDVNLNAWTNEIFDYVKAYFAAELDSFRESNKNNLNSPDFLLQDGVNEAIYEFVSNKLDFKNVISYLLRSVHQMPIGFYKQRFQGEQEVAYSNYINQFGSASENCLYFGPILDLFEPSLTDNKLKDDIITLDIEFTSFNKVNIYSSKPQQIGKPLKFSYPITLPNDRLLLEFRPDYLVSQIIRPIDYHEYNGSSINLRHELNTNDSVSVSFPVQKLDFSENQYKLCLLISCGEDSLVVRFLKDKSITDPLVRYDHEVTISPNKLNLQFYNLLRIYELDDYISTKTVNNDKLYDQFTLHEPISEVEDAKAYFSYFQVLLKADQDNQSYMSILKDYFKTSSLQYGLEGFTNQLSDKLFNDLGLNQSVLLIGLSRKHVLYSHINLTLQYCNEQLETDLKNIRNLIVNRK